MIRFQAQAVSVDAAAGDQPTRTISGIAVPYNETAIVSDGTAVRILQGALPVDGKAPKLFMYHDSTQPVGLVTAREDTDAGMLFSAKISATAAGDEALTLALDGVLDSVSVGVNPTAFSYDNEGTMIVSKADWLELSLVPIPAFAGAQITEIAASADETVLDSEPEPDATSTETEEPPVDIKPETVEAATPTPLFAQPARQFRLPSAAEYLASMHRGGAEFAQLNANIRAAAGDEVIADVPGIVPAPIVSPIFDDINPLRPLVSALGPRSMPAAGKIFIRPVITTHTEVGAQATELTGLDSRTMVVDDVQITKGTYGGVVQLSEQVIDWSDPAMLSAVLTDLAGQYALATELAAVTELVGAVPTGNRQVVTDWTDAEEVIGDLYDAAAAIGSIGNYLPTHLVVSPKTWARLAKLSDQSGRPLFPQVGPMNAPGTMSGAVAYNGNPLGLQLVVSNQITTQAVGTQDAEDYAFMLNARSMECYEMQKGSVYVEVPSTLGRSLAFRGYFAAKVLQAAGVWAVGPAQ